MARKGKENLIIPTSEEARKNGQKGGRASGEARRKRKALKETMEMLLELPVNNRRAFNKMSEFGIDVAEINNNTRLAYSILQKAFTGDVAAAREARSIIGEDVNADAISRLDELLKGIRDNADSETE